MPHSYYLSIDYEDNSVEDTRQNVYRAVVLTLPDVMQATEPEIRFATNDPVEDFKAAHRLVHALRVRFQSPFMFSSSVNDFAVHCYGYRFNEDDYLVEDPEEPLFDIPTIDYEPLSLDEKIAVAVTKESLGEVRGVTYLHKKAYAPLESTFLEADRAYREFCFRFGLRVEPLFDEEHYRRERLAMGDALFTEVHGAEPQYAGLALGRKDRGHAASSPVSGGAGAGYYASNLGPGGAGHYTPPSAPTLGGAGHYSPGVGPGGGGSSHGS